MLRSTDDTIAEWVGVDVTRELRGEHEIITYETRYGPINASNDLRWARASRFVWLSNAQILAMRMESGMTAQEVGAEMAELYGPRWSPDTPWRLYRGMTWNQMSDPDLDCEVLSASPEEVRARCREHYRDLIESFNVYFSVSPEDVFENGRAFAVGVADMLGMVWTETLDDGYRLITVTRK
jgi:hypothetical protein